MCWPERQEMQKVIVSLVHSIHVLSLLAKGKDWEAHFPSWEAAAGRKTKHAAFQNFVALQNCVTYVNLSPVFRQV